MKKYILIENIHDLFYILDRKDKFKEFIIMTPSVPVLIEGENANLQVIKLSFNNIQKKELMKFEDDNCKKTIELRLAISDYLNNLNDYPFTGFHHPDFFILSYKQLLFAFEYRYFLLSKILDLNMDNIYVFNDINKIKNRIEFLKNNLITLESTYFSRYQRGFSNILLYSKKGKIIKEIKNDNNKFKKNNKKILQNYVIGKFIDIRNKKIIKKYDEIILSDLSYKHVMNLNEKNIYQLRIGELNKEYKNYKKKKYLKIENIVNKVMENVVFKRKDLFTIMDFNYFEYINEIIKIYIREEITLLFWASKYINKFHDVKISSVHSAVSYNSVIFSIFKTLSQKKGVHTFSYPHGCDGYCDSVFQDRNSISSADFRFVCDNNQIKHFKEKQDEIYPSCYHTKFIWKKMSYLKNNKNNFVKKYGAIYVMNSAPQTDIIYTSINYLEYFDYFEFQLNLIKILVDISNKNDIKICIRPYMGNQTKLLYPYLFKNISNNIHISLKDNFVKLLNFSDKIIIDYPSTVLLQSMETNKKIFCINTHMKINEKYKKIIKDYGLTYIETNDNKTITKKLNNFLCERDV